MALPTVKGEIAFDAGPVDVAANTPELTENWASISGALWTQVNGVWSVASGRVGSTSVANSFLVHDSGSADGRVAAYVYPYTYSTTAYNPTAGAETSGIVVRYADANNFIYYQPRTGLMRVVVAGSVTVETYFGPADGDLIEIEMIGDYLYVYRNKIKLPGYLKTSTHKTNTKHGFRANSDSVSRFGQFICYKGVTWTDVTSFMRFFTCDGGREFEFDRMNTRTSQVKFNNATGRFDPQAQNAPAPYAGNIVPNKRFRFSATYSAVQYYLYHGLIENYTQSSPSGKTDYSEVDCELSDLFKLLFDFSLPRPYFTEVSIDQPDHFWRLNELVYPWYDSGYATMPLNASPADPGVGYTGHSTGVTDGTGDYGVRTKNTTPVVNAPGLLATGAETTKYPTLTYRTGDFTFEFHIRFEATGGLSIPTTMDERFLFLPSQSMSFTSSLSDDYYQLSYSYTDIDLGRGVNLLWDYVFRVGSNYHVAIERVANTGELNLYVNGRKVGTATREHSFDPGLPVTAFGTVSNHEQMIFISTDQFRIMNGDYIVGTMFDVTFQNIAFYRKALGFDRYYAHHRARRDAFGEETSGARISTVLEMAGILPHMQSIDAGQTSCAFQIVPGPLPIRVTDLTGQEQISNDEKGSNGLEYIQKISDSEDGIFFVSGDGFFTFHDRHKKLKPPQTVSQATFGDGAGELKYGNSLNPVMSLDKVFTVAVIDRTEVGGFVSRVEDEAARKKYGPRVFSRQVVNNSDDDAQALGSWVVLNNKDPKQRIEAIEHYPQNADTWASILPRAIGDRVTLKRRPTGSSYSGAAISADYRIESVGHTWDMSLWVSRFAVSPAPSTYWILGTNTLGTDTILGY